MKINNEVKEYYSAIECRNGLVTCKQLDQAEEEDFRTTIAEMKAHKSLVTHYMFLP